MRLSLYHTYTFTGQDPAIRTIRSIKKQKHLSVKEIAEESGVSPNTIARWLSGSTNRPQFCTVQAVVRSMGYDYKLVERKSNR